MTNDFTALTERILGKTTCVHFNGMCHSIILISQRKPDEEAHNICTIERFTDVFYSIFLMIPLAGESHCLVASAAVKVITRYRSGPVEIKTALAGSF